MMTPRRHLLALLVVAALPASALADAKSEAREHIDRATAMHGDGRFAEALVELNTAYTLDPQPDLLYAIGQINVKLGNCKQAILFYKRYLKTKPDKRAAASTKLAIKTCKSHPPPPAPTPPAPAPAPAVEPAPPVVEPAPEPAPAVEPAPVPLPLASDDDPAPPITSVAPPPPIDQGPEVTRPWYTDVLADVLLGGGLIAGGAAAFMYTQARSDLDEAEDATDYDTHEQLVDDARGKRNLALGLAAGSAVLIGAGVVRLIVHDRTERRKVVVAPVAGGGGLVILEGRF
jgi:hypothetical protein